MGDSRYRPELYSIGHRNPQGLAFNAHGVLSAHEHGPQGEDEINRIERGFPECQNSLFVGALKAQMLIRLVFEDAQFKQ